MTKKVSVRKPRVNRKLRRLMRSESPRERAAPMTLAQADNVLIDAARGRDVEMLAKQETALDWIKAGKPYLPTGYEERKTIPVMTGVLDYFPLALIEVAKVSAAGNRQHNPGEELHWARGKSKDEINTALRHLMERGGLDTDGQPHLAKAAWRVLAALQKECEERLSLPISRGSKPDPAAAK